ncbi:DJ-1/PfpI family protein [Candidatus Altiarchaeota archaeon]
MSAKKVLMILAPLNFRDEEYKRPRKEFESAGFDVSVASSGFMEAQGMLGAKVKVNLSLSEVNVDDFDAVVFVGGQGSSQYFNDEVALNIARDAASKEKVIAATTIAPIILANAGVLNGRNATAWSSTTDMSFIAKIKNSGAEYVATENVVSDGNIVTATGPEYAQEFGQKVVEVLNAIV